MSFHLGLFGIPELRDVNGRGVRLRTQKQLALLVYLALEARVRPASRDALVDLLWPDAPEAKGRHSLSQALSAIRGVLGATSVECIRNTIVLNSGLTTDLERGRLSEVAGDLASPLRDLDRCAGTDFAQWLDHVAPVVSNTSETCSPARLVGHAPRATRQPYTNGLAPSTRWIPAPTSRRTHSRNASYSTATLPAPSGSCGITWPGAGGRRESGPRVDRLPTTPRSAGEEGCPPSPDAADARTG